MKYLITRIVVKGVNTISPAFIETDNIESIRKEVAKRHSVKSGKVKFNYEETE